MVVMLRRLFSPFACLAWGLVLVMLYLGLRLVEKQFGFELLGGSTQHIADARVAVQQNDWAGASAAIQKVPPADRHRTEFLRVLADYLKGTRTDPALLSQVVSRLAAQGSLNTEDFVWLCQEHLAAGKATAARETLQFIPDELRKTLPLLEVELAILAREGRHQESAEVMNQMFKIFADDPTVALNQAIQDLRGTFPEMQRSARGRLWEIAQGEDAHGLAALRILAKAELTLAESEQLLRLADGHPNTRAADRLAVVSILMRLAPERRENLLNQATLRLSGNHAATQSLATWLAQENEFARMQKLLSSSTAMSFADSFVLTAQGLAKQERWSALLELLNKGRQLPVSAARTATWRALAAKHLHPDDLGEARTHMQEAIRRGGVEKDSLAVLGAARMAEEWSMPDLALAAYLTLAEPGTRQESEMLEKCWYAAVSLRDEGLLENLARRLAATWPDNGTYALRYEYLRLLRGEKITMSCGAGPSTSATGVPAASRLLTESLKAYRLGDLFLSAYYLRSITDASTLALGERAVFAGLLAATCGETARAYQIAEKIHPRGILNCEMAFLDMAW